MGLASLDIRSKAFLPLFTRHEKTKVEGVRNVSAPHDAIVMQAPAHGNHM